ncbi:acyl-CoA N-acyltransferase [Cladochytrium replicatum]|nr:acyl-CoA N-acyltransferase [Cladochytrium replicatum]
MFSVRSAKYSGPFDALPAHILVGPRLTLEPITELDDDLGKKLYNQACVETDIFLYMPFGPFLTIDEFLEFFRPHILLKSSLLYVAYENESYKSADGRKIVGVVGYVNAAKEHFRVEIGPIWTGMSEQGKGYGVELAALLIWHAFENADIVRVEWKCHHLNTPSFALAKRVGMTWEGTFKKHMFYKGGWRDSMLLAILRDEYFDEGRRDALLGAVEKAVSKSQNRS